MIRIFTNLCIILHYIFHLNHLVIYSNVIWTYNEICCTVHHISHVMEYFAKLFLAILILSLTPLLTIDFSLNHKIFLRHLYVCKYCAYRVKLEWKNNTWKANIRKVHLVICIVYSKCHLSFSYFEFKLRLIRLGLCFEIKRFLYSNSQPTDSQSGVITITLKSQLGVGDTEKLTTFSYAWLTLVEVT